MLFAGTCAAATLDSPQYHHTAWSMEQGAPADIWALAQGRDGYLWLGTGTGLYRFDGLEFEHYEPPPQRFATSNVTALYMAADDTLWIGFLLGGISAMRDGTVTHYRAEDGAPTGMVLGFATDRDRAVWVASISGLMRFDGHRWHRVGEEWGYPGERADALLLDSRGALWVSTGETVLYLPRGERRFRPTGERVSNFPSFAEAPDGKLWLSDRLHGTRPLPRANDACAMPRPAANGFTHFAQMRFDRRGVLWGTDRIGGGVIRVSSPQRVRGERGLRAGDVDAIIRKRDGLSSDKAVPVLEDREGNVWIGTNMGLHRFRYNNVRTLRDERLHQQLSYGIAIGREHEVLASSGGHVYGVRDGMLEPVVETGEYSIAGMVTSRDGSVWLSSLHHVARLRGGELTAITPPAGAGPAVINLLAHDGGDGVLAMHEGRGLYQYDGTRWREIGAGGLKALNATALLRRSDGSIWIGYLDNALTRWDGATKQDYSARDGLDVGTITALADFDLGLLVAGESGLAVFHEGRFQRLLAAQSQLLQGITGIVVTGPGELWLNGIRGVVRVEREALHRSMSDPRRELALRVFNFDDGLPGVAQQATVSPSAALGRDGRIWFATNQGLAMIDPAQLRSNAVAPPVSVRALFAEGRRHPAVTGLRLPKGTTDLRIDYTALSLSVPERVQLRYRLGGVDRHWQEAGNRRQAFYTNLGPGDYRFHVIAANDSGVWNEQGATLEFRIEPRFTQTWWFAALCVIAIAGVLFSLYLLRLRQIAERVHLRLEERHQERERIARELHDTLLQGIQGLILRFQAIANRLPMDDPTRTAMEQALDRADEAIAEGRDRVSDLRASMVSPDLAAAFVRIGEELAESHPVDFRVMVEGRLPVVDPVVREEIYWIGREVLANAFRHAEASRIEVEISAGMETLSFRFRDNGRGMHADVQQAAKSRHWGLRGIRERAQGISAELGIWSKEGGGTEVELVVPMNAAYIRSRRQGWRERLTRAWRR